LDDIRRFAVSYELQLPHRIAHILLISCIVSYVRPTPGPKGPTCSARLQCSERAGQAEKKTTANRIIRPGDANQIFVGPEFTSLKRYQRCSSGETGAKP
jgi:hypothetical protein